MAKITINEVSQNYSFNVGNNSYCQVALPITACWGPGYFNSGDDANEIDSATGLSKEQLMLENLSWLRFPSTREGMETFVSTYRGPAAIYRSAKDYSYQMALTLLSAGYDVLVCRLCPGAAASKTLKDASKEGNTLTVKAKYPGTFGNNLMITLNKVPNKDAWNLIVYVVDSSGVKSAVENIIFAFELDNTSDSIVHIDDIDSNFVTLEVTGNIEDSTADFDKPCDNEATEKPADGKTLGIVSSVGVMLGSDTVDPTDKATTNKKVLIKGYAGSDRADEASDTVAALMEEAAGYALTRFNVTLSGDALTSASKASNEYLKKFNAIATTVTLSDARNIRYKQWLYTTALKVYDLLKDKLAYNPNRVMSPGWDDQNIKELEDTETRFLEVTDVSPLHQKLMEIGYYSRCATALLDTPKSLPRNCVYNDDPNDEGYAQMLARFQPSNSGMDINGSLFHTHSALFGPWGQYTYTSLSKQCEASPSFLYLMINRAMILNQTVQYEWMLPTNRKHNMKQIGKMDYKIPETILHTWQPPQKDGGVGVNIITQLPDLGTTVWGNSTLFEVPPATYQALANLSTRYLFNAVEDVVYRTGVSITFQYNNDDAYSKFYAAVTPILDTMKNAGAIEGYYVRMSADINGLDQVNANTVIGKVYLIVNGVINDIVVDLVAMPPGTDLTQF